MKIYFKYLALLFFILTFLWMAKVTFNNGYPDFSNFYFGPFSYHNGINPYIANRNLFTPTTYPPIIFLVFYPITFLNLYLVEKLWTLGSILALLISIFLLFKIYKQKIFSTVSLILSGLVFLSFPVKFTLGMGQVNIYILLLIVVFMYLFNKSKKNSGIFLGTSILIKFFPFVMIFYLLLKKQWKILTTLLLTIGLGILLMFLLIKPDINLYYVKHVLPTLFDSWKGDYYNQSLSGLITRFNLNTDLRFVLRNIISLILVITNFLIIYLRKNKDMLNINLEISSVITLSLLVNSFSWQHHFAWMLIPFFSMFFYLKHIKASKYYYFMLCISYVLIAWNFKNPLEYPILLQSHVFFGTLLMWFLQMHLLSRNTTIITPKKIAK